MNHVEQAASRATGITSQLLSFSRVSEEKSTLLDFNEIIREASQLARRSMKGTYELVLETPPEPAKVRIDSTRASQIILNLCVNAQDAMPEGGRLTLCNQAVTLSGGQAERTKAREGAKFIRCSVSDTGTGIPPEILPRIFEAFYTTKGSGKGTGLGLSIVQRVVSQAGGFLDVETALGKGTTFHVYLPAAEGVVESSRRAGISRTFRGAGRILVVDDLDLIREFSEAFLRSAGFDVAVAGSAPEALEAIEVFAQQKNPFDLIFTDYNMPGANGAQLIEEANERWPQLKFILATGMAEETDLEKVRSLSNVRLLKKPYATEDAAETIGELLGLQPS